MKNRLPLDEVKSLEPLVDSISRLVAHGLRLGKADLAQLLSDAGLAATIHVINELKYWGSLFEDLRKEPTERNRLLIIERLSLRGVSHEAASRGTATTLEIWLSISDSHAEQTGPLYPIPIDQIDVPVASTDPICKLIFSPTGRYLVTLDNQGVACLWDTTTLELAWSLNVTGKAIHSAVFTPSIDSELDSELFLCEDGLLRCCDIINRCDYWQKPLPKGYGVLRPMIYLPGVLVAIADGDTISIWDSVEEKQTLLAQEPGGVDNLAFGPDDDFLAWRCHDGSIAIWSIPERKRILRLSSDSTCPLLGCGVLR